MLQVFLRNVATTCIIIVVIAICVNILHIQIVVWNVDAFQLSMKSSSSNSPRNRINDSIKRIFKKTTGATIPTRRNPITTNVYAPLFSKSSTQTNQPIVNKQQQDQFQPTLSQQFQQMSKTADSNVGGNSNSLISNVISKLAVLALQNRLREQTDVSCVVSNVSLQPTPRRLNNNNNSINVGPVVVTGKGWVSPTGLLTCRAIQASINICQLDIYKIFTQQKLLLIQPSYGKAIVGLNSNDFANFITHPLVIPPEPIIISTNELQQQNQQQQISINKDNNNKIQFLKECTKINPIDSTVSFLTLYNGRKYLCTLRRGQQVDVNNNNNDNIRKAIVDVIPYYDSSSSSSSSPSSSSSSTSADTIITSTTNDDNDTTSTCTMLSLTLSNFFNTITFNLDGTYLTYRDMMITPPLSSSSSSSLSSYTQQQNTDQSVIMLALNIIVEKFPSPGINF